ARRKEEGRLQFCADRIKGVRVPSRGRCSHRTARSHVFSNAEAQAQRILATEWRPIGQDLLPNRVIHEAARRVTSWDRRARAAPRCDPQLLTISRSALTVGSSTTSAARV